MECFCGSPFSSNKHFSFQILLAPARMKQHLEEPLETRSIKDTKGNSNIWVYQKEPGETCWKTEEPRESKTSGRTRGTFREPGETSTILEEPGRINWNLVEPVRSHRIQEEPEETVRSKEDRQGTSSGKPTSSP